MQYLNFPSLMALIPSPDSERLWDIIRDNQELFLKAQGSSHNHQAWEGGYLDHVAETMNIACQLYNTLNRLRKLPFSLSDALEVMFLHDIEKPFKEKPETITPLGVSFKEHRDKALAECAIASRGPDLKKIRRQFRADIIEKFGIELTPEQENALQYVEGVPDSEYTPGERTMGELAAFCHCADILSARLWHDKGANVPAPAWE